MKAVCVSSFAVAAITLAGLSFRPVASTAAEPLTLNNGQMYLVLDHRLGGVGDACTLQVHSFHRYAGNPIIKPDPKWPHGVGQILWDENELLFKMWYYAGSDGTILVGYATSKDGIQWERPSLGQLEVRGSRDNNIVYTGVVPALVRRFPKAAAADQRYVMWALQMTRSPDGIGEEKENGIYRFTSPDGVRWSRASTTPCIPGNAKVTPTFPDDPDRPLVEGVIDDVSCVYWLEQLGKYVCYHKVMTRNPRPYSTTKGVGNIRQFARFESTDGITWNTDKPTWAFYVDDKDEAWEPYLQFYGIGILPVGDLYLATTMEWHSGKQDNMEVGLAYSTDTIKWHRPFRGRFILPRSAEGEWDWGQTRQAAGVIEKDGMWWLYYTGYPFTHDDPLRRQHYYTGIGLARTPVGRIVSARSWKSKGTWTVGPLVLNGQTLSINARVYKEMDIEVLDNIGQPIAGFTAKIKMRDETRLPVEWTAGKLADLKGKPVKIRFNMYDAELFAITCD